MADFLGYFFKTTKNGVNFPNNYIKFDSYTCEPDIREEIKAYRDENTRELYRVTADGMKTKITFTTTDNLHKASREAIMSFFTTAEALESDSTTAAKQRKVQLTFWDDEKSEYRTSYFYRPNMEFKIKKIVPTGTFDSSSNEIYDIIYKEIEMELIEY